MKVHGYEVPTWIEANALAWMADKSAFNAGALEMFLEREGVPEWSSENVIRRKPIAHRVADRLLQRERKAGRVKLIGHQTWAPSAPLKP